MAKKGDVASRRILLQRIQNKPLVHKLVDDIASRYKDRKGGYTRITKLAKVRKRDGSRLVEISLV
jgi:large subunit ribosomal protein L17